MLREADININRAINCYLNLANIKYLQIFLQVQKASSYVNQNLMLPKLDNNFLLFAYFSLFIVMLSQAILIIKSFHNNSGQISYWHPGVLNYSFLRPVSMDNGQQLGDHSPKSLQNIYLFIYLLINMYCIVCVCEGNIYLPDEE